MRFASHERWLGRWSHHCIDLCKSSDTYTRTAYWWKNSRHWIYLQNPRHTYRTSPAQCRCPKTRAIIAIDLRIFTFKYAENHQSEWITFMLLFFFSFQFSSQNSNCNQTDDCVCLIFVECAATLHHSTRFTITEIWCWIFFILFK